MCTGGGPDIENNVDKSLPMSGSEPGANNQGRMGYISGDLLGDYCGSEERPTKSRHVCVPLIEVSTMLPPAARAVPIKSQSAGLANLVKNVVGSLRR